MGNIGSHVDLTSGRRRHQAKPAAAVAFRIFRPIKRPHPRTGDPARAATSRLRPQRMSPHSEPRASNLPAVDRNGRAGHLRAGI